MLTDTSKDWDVPRIYANVKLVMSQALEALYVPLLERHIHEPPKGQENTVQPYTRVLGSCRSFLSAYKHAEERSQGMRASSYMLVLHACKPLMYHPLKGTQHHGNAMLGMGFWTPVKGAYEDGCRAESIYLPMPDLLNLTSNEALEEEALTKLESAMAQWVSALQAALSHEADRVINGTGGFCVASSLCTDAMCLATHTARDFHDVQVIPAMRSLSCPCKAQPCPCVSMYPGPLAEMDFWQARFEALGILKAQLDTPHARSLVALLRTFCTDRSLLASFQSHVGELSRVHCFPP